MKSNKIRIRNLLACFSDTPDDLIFWSFRYFLGRQTIATCCFAKDLAKAWPYLNEHIANLIQKELNQAFEKDDQLRADPSVVKCYYPLGADSDRAAWERVRRSYTK